MTFAMSVHCVTEIDGRGRGSKLAQRLNSSDCVIISDHRNVCLWRTFKGLILVLKGKRGMMIVCV